MQREERSKEMTPRDDSQQGLLCLLPNGFLPIRVDDPILGIIRIGEAMSVVVVLLSIPNAHIL